MHFTCRKDHELDSSQSCLVVVKREVSDLELCPTLLPSVSVKLATLLLKKWRMIINVSSIYQVWSTINWQLSNGRLDKFKNKVMSELEKVVINGCEESNYPGILNLSFAAVEGESLLMRLPGIALSSGSACTSASLEPSYVLRSMGSDVDLAHSSIRFVSFLRSRSLKVLDLVLDDLRQKKKLTTQPMNW